MPAELKRKPTHPSECVLAICLPTSFEEFSRDIRLGYKKDFAVSTAWPYRDLPIDTVWEAKLARDTRVLVEVARVVEALGVTVRMSVSAADFLQLLPRYKVVTLVTHWRSSALFPGHILDRRGLISALNARASELIATSRRFPRDGLDDALDETALCAILNRMILEDDLSIGALPSHGSGVLTALHRAYANRRYLDEILAGAIVPGNRMEFCDGMMDTADVVACLPDDPSFTLDLTMCNSVMFAKDTIGRKESTIIYAIEEIDLYRRSILYEEQIGMISKARYNYVDAARDIRIAIMSQMSSAREDRP